MTPAEGAAALDILRARDGLLTRVTLVDGSVLDVWDIACGRDLGDEYDHISTNISPPRNDRPSDFFFAYEISSIADSEGRSLFPLGAEL